MRQQGRRGGEGEEEKNNNKDNFMHDGNLCLICRSCQTPIQLAPEGGTLSTGSVVLGCFIKRHCAHQSLSVVTPHQVSDQGPLSLIWPSYY